MPPANKISSELSDANLIDTDNQNTTMVKISVVNAGCQAEKSVLMLFNKNQKVLISIDATDGSENQGVIVGHDDAKPVPTKRPNGVELEIDEAAEDNTKLDDEEVTEEVSKAPGTAKPTKATTKATTTKRLRATRTTRPPRTTTQRVRTTRSRPSRKPTDVEYDENDNVTSAPTKKKNKRRRTKGNKKRKGNRNVSN